MSAARSPVFQTTTFGRKGVFDESKRSNPPRRSRRGARRQRRRGKRRTKSRAVVSGFRPPYMVSGPRSVFSSLSQTPDRTFVRLRYLEPGYTTGTMTGGSTYIDYYRINSVFDPYVGVGGGQPSGTGRMFSQYQYCRIWGATITVNVARTEHQQDYPWDFAVVPMTPAMVASPPTSFSQFIEQPYSVIQRGVSVLADQSHTIEQHISIPKLFGVSAMDMVNPAFYHDSASNPVNDCQWAILLLQPILTVDNTILELEVFIDYDCEFFNRNSIPGNVMESKLQRARDEHLRRLVAAEPKPIVIKHERKAPLSIRLEEEGKTTTTESGVLHSKSVVATTTTPSVSTERSTSTRPQLPRRYRVVESEDIEDMCMLERAISSKSYMS